MWKVNQSSIGERPVVEVICVPRRKTSVRETEKIKYMMYPSNCMNTYDGYKSWCLSKVIYER